MGGWPPGRKPHRWRRGKYVSTKNVPICPKCGWGIGVLSLEDHLKDCTGEGLSTRSEPSVKKETEGKQSSSNPLVNEIILYLERYKFTFAVSGNWVAARHYTGNKVFVVVVHESADLAKWGPTVRGMTLNTSGFKDVIYRTARYWEKPHRFVPGEFNKGTLTDMGWHEKESLLSRHQSIDCVVAQQGVQHTIGALLVTGYLHPIALDDLDWFKDTYESTSDSPNRERLTNIVKTECQRAITRDKRIGQLLGSLGEINRFFLVHS